jgi:hypothetical protein
MSVFEITSQKEDRRWYEEETFSSHALYFLLDVSFCCWRLFAVTARLLVPSSRLYDRHA